MPQQATWPKADAKRVQLRPLPLMVAYERAEASAVFTCSNTDQRLITFSGTVDAVTLTATAFGAIFTLLDGIGRTICEYTVDEFSSHDAHIRCRAILVRNLTAGSNAIVQVVGKWAERGEAANGNP